MKKQVVVTGLGAVTPLGNDVPSFWEGLVAGRSGVDRIASFDPSGLEVQIAAEVKGFDPVALFDRRIARRNGRFTLFALEAARQAINDAGLDPAAVDRTRVGVLIGTGIGEIFTLLENYDIFKEAGPHRVTPFLTPIIMPNAASGVVSITYGFMGPNLAVVSACASGTHSIAMAMDLIRHGKADVMISGSSEAATHPLSMAALGNAGALSRRNDEPQRASRPFDAERDGFVISEGCGILVLESLEHARARGARIYCELIGYGASADAFHITAPDENGTGAAMAMQRALDDAGIAPQDVDYINAHGTSTPLNDRIETTAIRAVFGAHTDRLAVSSTKSMVGHLMGAAGAVEAVACVKTIETGWVHPTINYEHPDPACDLDYVPNQARQSNPRVVLSNSFGFGGHNGCLLFRRWEERP